MKYRFIPILVVLLLTLAACGGRQEVAPETAPQGAEAGSDSAETLLGGAEAETEPQPAEPRYLPETAEEPEAAEAAPGAPELRAVVDGMTLEEKVGQLFFVHCPAADAAEKIAAYHPGGVLLFTSDFQDAAGNWLTREAFIDKVDSLQQAAGRIPLFVGSDEEGGTVTRASRNPNLFPAKSKSPQALYASGGLDAILLDTAKKSNLLTSAGINVNFAPVCDVSTDPNDFIYDRSFGRNAAETMAYVMGVVSVMRDSGVGSVLKHFPGYGNNADTHTGVAVDERPIETFQNSDFLPFLGGIRAEAPFVLVSHNIVTCMDPDLPASLSPAVHGILRDELGFGGVILTDDLNMDAVSAYAEDGNVAALALLAGNDMLVTVDFERQIPQVLAAVQDGTLDESLIDAAVLRVLTAKLALGLLGE